MKIPKGFFSLEKCIDNLFPHAWILFLNRLFTKPSIHWTKYRLGRNEMGKYWARGQNDKRSSLKSVWSVDSLFTTIAYSNIQKLLQVKLKFPSRKKKRYSNLRNGWKIHMIRIEEPIRFLTLEWFVAKISNIYSVEKSCFQRWFDPQNPKIILLDINSVKVLTENELCTLLRSHQASSHEYFAYEVGKNLNISSIINIFLLTFVMAI